MINDKKSLFDFMTALAIGFLLMVPGCSKHLQVKPIPLSDSVIIPSQGIKSCYVGMPVSQLQDEWVSGDPDNIFEKDFLINSKMGLSVRPYEGKVFGVGFQLDIEGYKIYEQPFTGTTDQGISAKDSIAEVIQAYGQPISITIGSTELDGEHVTLYYEGRGTSRAKTVRKQLKKKIFHPPRTTSSAAF